MSCRLIELECQARLAEKQLCCSRNSGELGVNIVGVRVRVVLGLAGPELDDDNADDRVALDLDLGD